MSEWFKWKKNIKNQNSKHIRHLFKRFSITWKVFFPGCFGLNFHFPFNFHFPNFKVNFIIGQVLKEHIYWKRLNWYPLSSANWLFLHFQTWVTCLPLMWERMFCFCFISTRIAERCAFLTIWFLTIYRR